VPEAQAGIIGNVHSAADLFRYATYFFHLEDRKRVEDKRGHLLPDDSAARREAERIEAALRRCRRSVWSVIVTNEWGHEVTQVLAPSQSSDTDEPNRTASTTGTFVNGKV
jgi:hypothetical protein